MLPTTTLGQGFGLEPVYLLGQARPIPSEAMKIIQSLHLTRAARAVKLVQAP
jgi:tagatose-1,6-bisphosphate aldolase non-catalytic subunit AgaZ/GatZ